MAGSEGPVHIESSRAEAAPQAGPVTIEPVRVSRDETARTQADQVRDRLSRHSNVKRFAKRAAIGVPTAAIGAPPAGVAVGLTGWALGVPGARELTIASAKGVLWWGKVLMPLIAPAEGIAFAIFAPPKIMEWAENIVKGEAIKFGGGGKKSSSSSGGGSHSSGH